MTIPLEASLLLKIQEQGHWSDDAPSLFAQMIDNAKIFCMVLLDLRLQNRLWVYVGYMLAKSEITNSISGVGPIRP